MIKVNSNSIQQIDQLRKNSFEPVETLKWLMEAQNLISDKENKAKEYYEYLIESRKEIDQSIRDFYYRKENKLTEDDIESLLETVVDIVEMVSNYFNKEYQVGELLEEFERRLIEKDDEYLSIKERLEKENQYAINRYFELKVERGLTSQQDVAQLMGMTQSYVSIIESGERKLQKKTLIRLAKGFGVDVSTFYPSTK